MYVSFGQIVIPIYVYCISEYKHNKKIPISHYAWLWIEPVMVHIAIAINIPNIDPTLSFKHYDLIGNYYYFHFTYVLIAMPVLVIWSVRIVNKKNNNSLYKTVQFCLCLATPMVLFTLFIFGFLAKPIGASTMILILLWAAKESNLLDAVPSALSGILNRVNVGVLVFNVPMQLVYSNAFARLFLPPFETAKKDNHKLTLSCLPDELKKPFDFDLTETQNVVVKLNKELSEQITSKKSPYLDCYIDATLSPIYNPKTEQFLGQTLLLQDVSERELSALSLADNNLQLTNLNQRKSDFFANISHEFRTPLTLSIGGLSDTLNGGYGALPSNFVPVLNNVKHNNQRLLTLVEQLLELSRLNQGQSLYRPTAINLSDVLSGVLANFESIALKQKITINVTNEADLQTLWFDENSLEKVLMNVISNAFKSIHQQGNIDLTISQQAMELSLSIKDSGHGIAEDVLPFIFDAFYYHDRANILWSSGTGIGLYMVKQILDFHGAHISVQSTADIGTEFTIRFKAGNTHLNHTQHNDKPTIITTETTPIASPTTHTNVHPTHTSNTSGINEYTEINESTEKLILIVEDNIQMRRYIRRHLGQAFRLIEAEDGEEGYALAQQSVPDLILSDLMMPKLNGFELSKKIRNSNATSHIPIILLTAKADPNDKLAGLKLGIDDYITKPFDASELIARVHNLIASREQLKQHFSSFDQTTQPDLSQVPITSNKETQKLVSKEALFLERLDSHVFQNMEYSNLRISSIADHFHMSERSLHRKLNALTGNSPKQYVMSLRMQEAQKRLITTTETANAIAISTGFNDAAHFSRAFKAQNQLTPLEFRKKHSQ